MFQIAPQQIESRIEEQRQFDGNLETLLERLDKVILKIGNMQSLGEFVFYLKSLYRRMEEQAEQTRELTLALERIRYRYEECEYAILERVENESVLETEAGFVCEELALPEGEWESILEFVTVHDSEWVSEFMREER